MKKRNFYNLITSLLITSFLLMPLAAIPQKAEAQLSGYISGLAPAIANLPLCKNEIKNVISTLFSGGPGMPDLPSLDLAALTKATDKIAAETNATVDKALNGVTDKATSAATSISVYSKEELAKLEEIRASAAKATETSLKLMINDTCYQSIGRLITKMLLQKITISTVAWINSGFDGKPAFIQDTGKFFGDIAKNEILQFGLEINNPDLFPFGKAFLKNQAMAFNNKFADNARYTLDQEIRNTTPQYSALAFSQDFSMGGWDAWSAMTQNPANNSLGFQIMASDELQKRLAGTTQSTAQQVQKALDQANGFLGDQRCADPVGLTKELDKKGLTARSNGDTTALICNRWEYVTPGKMIADKATESLKYPGDQLLKASDLNDAMAAVMDALLSKFSSTLMEKGFAALDNTGADGSFVYNPDSARANYSNQTEKDFTPTQLSSSWLQANPDFNIRTDLTQALIDEQRTYSDKLAVQNKELNSTTGGDYKMGTDGISNAYGLIPAINQLDYCIPGPHPGWEDDSRGALDAVTNKIIPLTAEDMKDKSTDQVVGIAQGLAPLAGMAIGVYLAGHFAVIGATFGSALPIAGTVIGAVVGAALGAVIAFAATLVGDRDYNKKLRLYYSLAIKSLTNVTPYYPDDGASMVNSLMSKQGAVQTLNVILERYIGIMHKVYSLKVLPSVAKEAATEYNKLQGYAQMIVNNGDAISSTKNVVDTLTQIKSVVDDLNTQLANHTLKDVSGNPIPQDTQKETDQYETLLQPQINAFGRLSASMVNGDDIASADNLSKQIVDEKNYIYSNLLKGPLGCEKDLQDNIQGLSDQLIKTTRMDYPFPILYTYNIVAGGNIPDPWNPDPSKIRFDNKTNSNAIYPSTLGPGFLSFYSFQSQQNPVNGVDIQPLSTNPAFKSKPDSCVAQENGTVPQCQMRLDDLIPLGHNKDGGSWSDKWINLGTTKNDPNGGTSGPFENMIGVY